MINLLKSLKIVIHEGVYKKDPETSPLGKKIQFGRKQSVFGKYQREWIYRITTKKVKAICQIIRISSAPLQRDGLSGTRDELIFVDLTI